MAGQLFLMGLHLCCPQAQPPAFEANRQLISNASSVVRIITGNTINPSVREPAIIESPNFSVLTNNAIPKSPKTIDGTRQSYRSFFVENV